MLLSYKCYCLRTFGCSIIDEEPDLTVKSIEPILIRSTTQRDAFINTAALAEMMEPQSKPIINYRKHTPLPPSFFDRIMLGGHPGRFVSTIAKHLPRYMALKATWKLCFLKASGLWLQKGAVAHTLISSGNSRILLLWSNLFSLLRRSAEDDQPDLYQQRNGLLVFPIIIKLAAIVMTIAPMICATASGVSCIFDKAWIAAGLWLALNEALTKGFIALQRMTIK